MVKPSDKKRGFINKHPVIRKVVIAVIILIAFIGISTVVVLVYNNVSFTSDEAFANQVDTAIEKGLAWTQAQKQTILKRKNIALIKMLKEADSLKATPIFSEIITTFMAAPTRPRCWKRLVDPNWPVDEIELNITIKKECIDNKWVLYAMAPDKAGITPEQMDLFNPERWQGRQLTHQLDALLLLRKTKGATIELDDLIEHLCNRLSSEFIFDVAVVDIYIQKVTFVLRAGFPKKIRRRWVERIIANQLDDGGWNDRWFWFTSDSRRPVFGFARPPSTQHATVQAMAALYSVKYRYPECFGLK